MMNAFLTEDTFKKATENYLKKYQYKTANQDNLWDELTQQGHRDNKLDANITIKEIMDTWTLQKGYPVVQVNNWNNTLVVTQKWFLLNPTNLVQNLEDQSEFESYRWYIPFTYTTSNELNFRFDTLPVWFKPEHKNCKLY